MHHFAALLLYLVPTLLSAQTLAPNCPVDASAKRQGAGGLTTVDGAQAGPRKWAVSIELRPRDAHRIVGATVVVYALSAKARTLELAGGVPDITREFRLQAGPGSTPEFAAGIGLDEPATVLWLEVRELRYADKSAWQAKPGAGCRVEPDNVVLIAALL